MHSTPVEIQKYLKGVDYPVSKEQLLATARDEGAPEAVLQDLQDLPDEEFESPTDITQHFGGERSETA